MGEAGEGQERGLKAELRERVWSLLVQRGVARFPLPVRGRIPNFAGAQLAARRLAGLREYERAELVFCNPDSPQRPVRELVLRDGKTLVMATPRLRRGLLLLEPSRLPSWALRKASTIRGAFRFGRPVEPWEVQVDLKVVGSVAVTPDGGRLGKGHGYSDLEYAILVECGSMGPETSVATTVHDVQVLPRGSTPMTEHDVPVDVIATPTRVIRTNTRHPRPKGLDWALITEDMVREMPILARLKERAGRSRLI